MPKRVLVVEDEVSLLQAVAVCLRAEGYEVATARNGEEALVQLAGSLPDLVLSDIRMPRMDGYALVRHLRSTYRTALIPIIFLTAKGETADRIEGFRSGVDAYLVKPFEPDELLAVVHNILNRVERTQVEFTRLASDANTGNRDTFHDEALTESEERVARAVGQGLTNKEIAAEFGISVRTVENHISHILDKKNFSNRVEIARYVLERKQPE